MGEEFLNPPVFDIEQSYKDSSAITPLIFMLPGEDPMQSIMSFANMKKKGETMRTISLGQG